MTTPRAAAITALKHALASGAPASRPADIERFVDELLLAARADSEERAQVYLDEEEKFRVSAAERLAEMRRAIDQLIDARVRHHEQIGRLIRAVKLQGIGMFAEAETIIGELEVERG